MSESSKLPKSPEPGKKEKGLTQQERSILIESTSRHRRALEELSRL